MQLWLTSSLVAAIAFRLENSTDVDEPPTTAASEHIEIDEHGETVRSLLAPAPKPPAEYYDYFGAILTPKQAKRKVIEHGLDPKDPTSYQRVGAVHVTKELRDLGGRIFFERKLGDAFGGHRLLGFGQGFAQIAEDLGRAIVALNGKATTNLRVTLSHELRLGSRTFPAGTVYPTGLDVEKGSDFPLGLTRDGNITCGLCHATLDAKTDKILLGAPNNDLDGAFFIALAPNSSAAFARLRFDPTDELYQGAGKQIIDSNGDVVTLPDPEKFERAFDDALLDEPAGAFESSPDGINNTTNIPTVFTFGTFPFGFSGNFAVGPFSGLSSINSAVHSSEINMVAASQISDEMLGIDREIYLGTQLQNAADPTLRLPDGPPVKPSEWLRAVAPDLTLAELEDQVAAPGAGTYPNLKPSLFSTNGLVFTPNTGTSDIASGPFLYAANAMSAWQESLVPPRNDSSENSQALHYGSVRRGAKIFAQASCATCHAPPFFTDNEIHGLAEMQTNPARARGHLGLERLFVAPKMYSLDTPVPIPAEAQVLDIPTEGISENPTTWPIGILPDGGYRTLSLRGLFLSAPYLHDGGVAVRAGALQRGSDGFFTVADPSGLGLAGTLEKGILADPSSSLRALVDRNLRQAVVDANQASPELVRSNLDGRGHEFWVDASSGFTPRQQTDLVNFLLALDDNPGKY